MQIAPVDAGSDLNGAQQVPELGGQSLAILHQGGRHGCGARAVGVLLGLLAHEVRVRRVAHQKLIQTAQGLCLTQGLRVQSQAAQLLNSTNSTFATNTLSMVSFH